MAYLPGVIVLDDHTLAGLSEQREVVLAAQEEQLLVGSVADRDARRCIGIQVLHHVVQGSLHGTKVGRRAIVVNRDIRAGGWCGARGERPPGGRARLRIRANGSRLRYGRCFLECQTCRLQRQCIFASTHLLGKAAPTALAQVAEHLVTGLQPLHASATRCNAPRDVSSEDRLLGLQQPTYAVQEGCTSQKVPVP